MRRAGEARRGEATRRGEEMKLRTGHFDLIGTESSNFLRTDHQDIIDDLGSASMSSRSQDLSASDKTEAVVPHQQPASPPTSGQDFFNSFFAQALDRAGLSDSDLRKERQELASDLQAASESTATVTPLPQQSSSMSTVPAAQLDCGSDPGPSAREMQNYLASGNAASSTPSTDIDSAINRRLGGLSTKSGTSTRRGIGGSSLASNKAAVVSAAAVDASDSEADDTEQTNGMYSSTGSLGRRGISSSSSASQPPSWDQHSRRSSASRNVLSREAAVEFAKLRGGGLGTPTGEKTFIGAFGSNAGGSGTASGTMTPVMDQHGLGWPAKKTLDRLQYTPEQAAANQARLAGAVRTVLECLGEDPDREGLQATPDRYAKALLWMTRGYEERLSGEFPSSTSGDHDQRA